jgi:hypothetical protein
MSAGKYQMLFNKQRFKVKISLVNFSEREMSDLELIMERMT